MSPLPVSLAEHRVCFGVGHELPHLLRAATSGGDLGSPRQRLLACGHVDDREPANDLLGLRVRPASSTTSCEALPTSGQSSAGMWSIAPSLNEIKYSGIPGSLVLAASQTASRLYYE